MKQFGFESGVILRSADEMATIMLDFPFTEAEIEQAQEAMPDVEHVYIYLSNEDIDTIVLENLCLSYSGNDKIRAKKRELYLLCYESVRNSKLAALLKTEYAINRPQPKDNAESVGNAHCEVIRFIRVTPQK